MTKLRDTNDLIAEMSCDELGLPRGSDPFAHAVESGWFDPPPPGPSFAARMGETVLVRSRRC